MSITNSNLDYIKNLNTETLDRVKKIEELVKIREKEEQLIYKQLKIFQKQIESLTTLLEEIKNIDIERNNLPKNGYIKEELDILIKGIEKLDINSSKGHKEPKRKNKHTFNLNGIK